MATYAEEEAGLTGGSIRNLGIGWGVQGILGASYSMKGGRKEGRKVYPQKTPFVPGIVLFTKKTARCMCVKEGYYDNIIISYLI